MAEFRFPFTVKKVIVFFRMLNFNVCAETSQSAIECQAIEETTNRFSNKVVASLTIQIAIHAVPRKPRTPTTRTSSIKTVVVAKPRTASLSSQDLWSQSHLKKTKCPLYIMHVRIYAIMKKLKQDGLLKKWKKSYSHCLCNNSVFPYVLNTLTKIFYFPHRCDSRCTWCWY